MREKLKTLPLVQLREMAKAQGYKTVKEKSAVVRFKVVGEDAYFLAWNQNA